MLSFFLDSQLITTGDSQVSIFNYANGDLLISLDLMKSYGTNLTTFEFEDVRSEFFGIFTNYIIFFQITFNLILELSLYGFLG